MLAAIYTYWITFSLHSNDIHTGLLKTEKFLPIYEKNNSSFAEIKKKFSLFFLIMLCLQLLRVVCNNDKCDD